MIDGGTRRHAQKGGGSRLCGLDTPTRPILLALAVVLTASLVAVLSFLLHFNLSTAGSLQLLLVLLVALRVGFLQASIASVTAVALLNYLFTDPVFRFTVADPQNWISLATFEITALLVSGLSTRVRLHAKHAETERERTAKLYDLSRAVLLIDRRLPTEAQLSRLIREVADAQEVELWSIYEPAPFELTHAAPQSDPYRRSIRQVYLDGRDRDDPVACVSERILHLGSTATGSLCIRGWTIDSVLADAVASLAAIAFERSNAIFREGQAEAERNAERLRSAVLDALAHGFKTPLTAIQTASSGLFAIGNLSRDQQELVSIVDLEASALNQLTTRLLKTAALDQRDMRLCRATTYVDQIIRQVLADQQPPTQDRTRLHLPKPLTADYVDPMIIRLAVEQLVDNAAKYSDVDRPIDITVTQAASETAIVVANEGPPIRTEDRARIFERFYRGARAGHGPSGTGLGLSIVRKAAEAHGGRVFVESESGVNRFIFSFYANAEGRA